MADRARGRRTGDSGTRDAIIDAARRQFADRGFAATTLRSVARAAGVDHRLVLHYFGSKGDLFKAAVEMPVVAEEIIERLFAPGSSDAGARAADLIVSTLDDPRSRRALIGILRAAVTEPAAAALIHDIVAERMLVPIAKRVGGDEPELRAAMVATSVIGLAIGRHVVGLQPLASASNDQLARALGPVASHYLSGAWVSPAGDQSAGTSGADDDPGGPSA